MRVLSWLVVCVWCPARTRRREGLGCVATRCQTELPARAAPSVNSSSTRPPSRALFATLTRSTSGSDRLTAAPTWSRGSTEVAEPFVVHGQLRCNSEAEAEPSPNGHSWPRPLSENRQCCRSLQPKDCDGFQGQITIYSADAATGAVTQLAQSNGYLLSADGRLVLVEPSMTRPLQVVHVTGGPAVTVTNDLRPHPCRPMCFRRTARSCSTKRLILSRLCPRRSSTFRSSPRPPTQVSSTRFPRRRPPTSSRRGVRCPAENDNIPDFLACKCNTREIA